MQHIEAVKPTTRRARRHGERRRIHPAHTVVAILSVLTVSLMVLASSLASRAVAAPPCQDLPPIPTPVQGATGEPSQPAGGLIELRVRFSDDWASANLPWQSLWTVVQRQESGQAWSAVEGWQGTLSGVESGVGSKSWWCPEDMYESGPFRWAVYAEQGGALLAVSQSFTPPGQTWVNLSPAAAQPTATPRPTRTPTATASPTATPTLTPTTVVVTPTSAMTPVGTATPSSSQSVISSQARSQQSTALREPHISLPAFDPPCGSVLARYETSRLWGPVGYVNVRGDARVVCMWYGVAADGSRQLEGLFSYDPVESQVSAARGKVQAFCSAAGKSWTYPEVELVVGLISVSAPETSEFVVASSTCRYAVVD